MKHHEFHVAGKNFAVEVHYLDHVVSKDGTRSLLDFSTITSISSGVIALFLEAELVFHEDLVVRGVYHAIKDQFKHGIVASDNPAINVLMHTFGTNQIEVIKQEIVPPSFNDPRAENHRVAMVLVSTPDNTSSLGVVLSEFSGYFSFFAIQAPIIPVALDAAMIRVWKMHRGDISGSPGTANCEAELLARTASARMAVFSLNLQQKN